MCLQRVTKNDVYRSQELPNDVRSFYEACVAEFCAPKSAVKIVDSPTKHPERLKALDLFFPRLHLSTCW